MRIRTAGMVSILALSLAMAGCGGKSAESSAKTPQSQLTTGALPAIPAELTDASRVDGAGAGQAFRAVTLPLLLVALTPLLISSFAFNFNNFNAVYLTTEGGPFPAGDPANGATDLLITYTYRLAFGGSGAQYGFAAAVSIFIFLIVAVVSAVSFRRTRRQEEVYA